MKKLSAIVLASVMASSICVTATGCGRNGGDKVDKNKTQLYISNFDAGIGRGWVERLGNEFANKFANYSFEPGKTGVQVFYNHTTENNTATFFQTMERDPDYIYFTESVDYYQYSNKFYDVSDIMNSGAITGVDSEGKIVRETKPVSEKIDSALLLSLNTGTSDNAVYKAFPFYLGVKTVTYDVDLWSEKGYFFAEMGCPSEIVVKALSEGGDVAAAITQFNTELNKVKNGQSSEYWWFVDKDGYAEVNGEKMKFGLSAGPDGKHGTFDDGLPATYEEFYLLLDKMSAEVTPFIWPGSNPGYADSLTTSLWENNEGVDNLKVHYSLNGTVDNLVKFDSKGNILRDASGNIETESETFTGGKDNGYEIQRTIEKYNALQFAQKIANNSNWTNAACYDGTTQSSAQSKYLTQGTTEVGQNVKRTAMLIDGCWWQQEALSTFEIMEKVDKKYSQYNREFSPMAMPNSTIERLVQRVNNNEKNTIVAANDSYCFINGALEEGSGALAVTKAFMSYIHSDEGLNVFAKTANMFRAVNSTISEDAISEMSLYAQNLVSYVENTNIVYPYSSNSFMNGNRTVFKNAREGWQWHTYNASTGEKYYPINDIHNSRGALTGEGYFKGLYNYYKNMAWAKLDMNA